MKRMLSVATPLLAFSLALASMPLRAAEMPAVGANAPAFTLQSQEGKTVSLKDFKGQWVVLYFYPKDMTQGCTIEAHNFQHDLDQYTAKHAASVGMSADSVDSILCFPTERDATRSLSLRTLSPRTLAGGKRRGQFDRATSGSRGSQPAISGASWFPMGPPRNVRNWRALRKGSCS